MLDVLDFGADPTAATGSQAAIQAAIDVAKTTGAKVYIPRGKYRIGTLDCSGIPDFPGGVTIEGDGIGRTLLYGMDLTGAYSMVDCANSSRVHLRRFSLLGMKLDGSAPTQQPQTGVLFGESSAGTANRNHLDSIEVIGHFGVACIGVAGSPNSLADFVQLQQWNASGFALYMSGYNAYQLASPFVTLAQGKQINEWTWRSCEFHAWNGINHQPGSAETIRLEGHTNCINNLSFCESLIDNSHNGAAIWSNGGLAHVSLSNCKVYSETGTQCQHVYKNGGGTVSPFYARNVQALVAGTPYIGVTVI